MPFMPATTMTFKLHEQTRDDEFAGIIDCENAGYSEPFNGFWEILRGPSAEELTERQKLWHSLDPSSRWLYVTDEVTGQVVGAMEWNIYEENPYADGVPDFPADWWPEDSPLRKISDYVLKEFLKDRPHVMGKPHVLISYCVVRPSHRHMGVGTLMMNWGLKLADSMKLPVFVESTEDGEGFYKRNDFDVIDVLHLDAPIPNQGPEFEEVRAKLLPMPGFVMARPLGGKKGLTNGLKASNGVKSANAAVKAPATNPIKTVISNAIFSDYQFLNCQFANCQFSNCSIANGSIMIGQENPPAETNGHATNENGHLTNGISV